MPLIPFSVSARIARAPSLVNWVSLVIAALAGVVLVDAVLWLRLLIRMQTAEFWEAQIRAFEEADRFRPPEPGAIVFTGSSSIRLWGTLEQDMAPLRVVN